MLKNLLKGGSVYKNNRSRNAHKSIQKNIILLFLLAALILCSCNSAADKTLHQAELSDSRIPQIAEGLKAGDTFTFGSYEQDNNLSNGAEPIEWQVLSVENNRALVISKFALDAKPYNETYINVTWRRSTLRKWLNGDFYNNAFNSSEKNSIATVTLDNPSNSCVRTMGGVSTNDRIFLLSYDEANQYFPDDDSRLCEATAFAKANGAYVGENGNSWWWLRSPGRLGNMAAIVLYVGYVSNVGYSVVDGSNIVRPAFWLDLS